MRIKAKELSELLDCSEPTAIKLIRKMNEELRKDGYLTIRGSVPTEYAYKRLYIKGETHEQTEKANQTEEVD